MIPIVMNALTLNKLKVLMTGMHLKVQKSILPRYYLGIFKKQNLLRNRAGSPDIISSFTDPLNQTRSTIHIKMLSS